MKTVLITGSNGLLGQKLILQLLSLPQEFKIIATSKGENRFFTDKDFHYVDLDISKKNEVDELFKIHNPSIVINTAAITNVDICEDEKELCWKINVDSVDNLVSACELNNAHLIHLSTDFIFDGLSGPYDENAIANPLSFYGESKVASEKIVSNATCPWTIVRTVLVYGTAQNLSRSNIVLWAKSALEKGQIINVVNDQFRTPTLAEDLADGCVKIAQQSKTGIYNISGDEFMSILELVERVANYFELTKENINVISSLTLNQAAKRPMITGFNIQKAIKDLAYSPVSFEQGLSIVKAQLKEI